MGAMLFGGHSLVGKKASQRHQNESTNIVYCSDEGQFVFVVFAHNFELEFEVNRKMLSADNFMQLINQFPR